MSLRCSVVVREPVEEVERVVMRLPHWRQASALCCPFALEVDESSMMDLDGRLALDRLQWRWTKRKENGVFYLSEVATS